MKGVSFQLLLFNPELFKVERVKVLKEFASEFEIEVGRFFRICGDIEITEVNRVRDFYKLLLRGVPNTETFIETVLTDDSGFLYRIKVKDKNTAIVEVYTIKPKHTCFYCDLKNKCEFAFDDYNTKGDCLMSK